MGITATEKAAKEVKRLCDKRAAEGKHAEGLRIGIRGGGCTGFAYLFEWADKPPAPTDKVFEVAEGVRIIVDPKSLVYLDGTELDFVTNIMGYGFKFNNPNTKGSCGCGESVQF
jgi:iron-sulfur cluster assembly protein